MKYFTMIELLDAMNHVENNLDPDNTDNIYVMARANISKKRKLCSQGHIK